MTASDSPVFGVICNFMTEAFQERYLYCGACDVYWPKGTVASRYGKNNPCCIHCSRGVVSPLDMPCKLVIHKTYEEKVIDSTQLSDVKSHIDFRVNSLRLDIIRDGTKQNADVTEALQSALNTMQENIVHALKLELMNDLMNFLVDKKKFAEDLDGLNKIKL